MSFFEKNLQAHTHRDFPVKYEIIEKLCTETPLETVETPLRDCPTAFGFDGFNANTVQLRPNVPNNASVYQRFYCFPARI